MQEPTEHWYTYSGPIHDGEDWVFIVSRTWMEDMGFPYPTTRHMEVLSFRAKDDAREATILLNNVRPYDEQVLELYPADNRSSEKHLQREMA